MYKATRANKVIQGHMNTSDQRWHQSLFYNYFKGLFQKSIENFLIHFYLNCKTYFILDSATPGLENLLTGFACSHNLTKVIQGHIENSFR